MLFKGRLRLPGDAGEGIPIDLTLEDVYLTLDSNGEGLGEWRLDVVEISRLFSNQFSLLLDGEEMVFVAADALGFAYEGLSFVEEVQSRLKKRRFFKGRKPKRSKAKPAPTEPQPEPEEPARSTPSSAPVPELAVPEVTPFFPEAAEERMAADRDAPGSQTSEPSPIAEPVSEPEVHTETPRRSLHPLGDPDDEVVDAYLDVPTPTEKPPTRPAPAAPTSPDITEPETAAPDTTDPDTATPAAAAVVEDEADDELVIEDVNPYGYQSPMTAIPEREARSDPEGTAGAPPTEESTQLVEPEPEPEPVDPVAEQANEPMVEEEPQEPQVAATAASPTPEPIASSASSSEEDADVAMVVDDDVDGSEPDEGPRTRVTQRTGRHAKGESGSRSSFFGRRKSKDPDPHDHVYESSKTVGGITRRVCSVCGHVSFAGEDVYQDW